MPPLFLITLVLLSSYGCGYFIKGPPAGHQNMASFECEQADFLRGGG